MVVAGSSRESRKLLVKAFSHPEGSSERRQVFAKYLNACMTSMSNKLESPLKTYPDLILRNVGIWLKPAVERESLTAHANR